MSLKFSKKADAYCLESFCDTNSARPARVRECNLGDENRKRYSEFSVIWTDKDKNIHVIVCWGMGKVVVGKQGNASGRGNREAINNKKEKRNREECRERGGEDEPRKRGTKTNQTGEPSKETGAQIVHHFARATTSTGTYQPTPALSHSHTLTRKEIVTNHFLSGSATSQATTRHHTHTHSHNT